MGFNDGGSARALGLCCQELLGRTNMGVQCGQWILNQSAKDLNLVRTGLLEGNQVADRCNTCQH